MSPKRVLRFFRAYNQAMHQPEWSSAISLVPYGWSMVCPLYTFMYNLLMRSWTLFCSLSYNLLWNLRNLHEAKVYPMMANVSYKANFHRLCHTHNNPGSIMTTNTQRLSGRATGLVRRGFGTDQGTYFLMSAFPSFSPGSDCTPEVAWLRPCNIVWIKWATSARHSQVLVDTGSES